MAIHCSILAWRIPWTEEPGGLQSMSLKELDMTEQLTLFSVIYLSNLIINDLNCHTVKSLTTWLTILC